MQWRHRSTWLYSVMLLMSCIALFVSFILAAETLQLARQPHQLLSCDINATISCSTVAKSWQAEIIHFGTLSFPNAYFGIAAESVFVTIAILGLSKTAFPRWFAWATLGGSFAALCYSYWLFTQSLYVIQALCPWCIVLMLSTTVQFMSIVHASVSVQHLTATERLQTLDRVCANYYRPNIDILVNIGWICIIFLLIILEKGATIL